MKEILPLNSTTQTYVRTTAGTSFHSPCLPLLDVTTCSIALLLQSIVS